MSSENEKYNDLIDHTVERAIEKYRKEQPIRYALEIDKESHDKEHEFIRGLMEVACKFEKIKWGVLGTVIKTVCGVLVIAMVIGMIVLAGQKMKGLVPLP